MQRDASGLDLTGLEQFRASDLFGKPAKDGTPMAVSLDCIEFDPDQPRKRLDAGALEELAGSIRTYGVLEPVSLRSHLALAGRFIVNRGERRVRAARLAGLATVPAFLDERIDPFAQAVENLHREDMTPFDLATFIAQREGEGLSRADIARRLGKPRSVITEAAQLIDAPTDLRAAFEAGRIGGRRTLYRLARALREDLDGASALLEGGGRIDGDAIDGLSAAVPVRESEDRTPDGPPEPVLPARDRGHSISRTGSARRMPRADALIVEFEGRRGTVSWGAQPDQHSGKIRFDDGESQVVSLARLKLLAWAAQVGDGA